MIIIRAKTNNNPLRLTNFAEIRPKFINSVERIVESISAYLLRTKATQPRYATRKHSCVPDQLKKFSIPIIPEHQGNQRFLQLSKACCRYSEHIFFQSHRVWIFFLRPFKRWDRNRNSVNFICQIANQLSKPVSIGFSFSLFVLDSRFHLMMKPHLHQRPIMIKRLKRPLVLIHRLLMLKTYLVLESFQHLFFVLATSITSTSNRPPNNTNCKQGLRPSRRTTTPEPGCPAVPIRITKMPLHGFPPYNKGLTIRQVLPASQWAGGAA